MGYLTAADLEEAPPAARGGYLSAADLEEEKPAATDAPISLLDPADLNRANSAASPADIAELNSTAPTDLSTQNEVVAPPPATSSEDVDLPFSERQKGDPGMYEMLDQYPKTAGTLGAISGLAQAVPFASHFISSPREEAPAPNSYGGAGFAGDLVSGAVSGIGEFEAAGPFGVGLGALEGIGKRKELQNQREGSQENGYDQAATDWKSYGEAAVVTLATALGGSVGHRIGGLIEDAGGRVSPAQIAQWIGVDAASGAAQGAATAINEGQLPYMPDGNGGWSLNPEFFKQAGMAAAIGGAVTAFAGAKQGVRGYKEAVRIREVAAGRRFDEGEVVKLGEHGRAVIIKDDPNELTYATEYGTVRTAKGKDEVADARLKIAKLNHIENDPEVVHADTEVEAAKSESELAMETPVTPATVRDIVDRNETAREAADKARIGAGKKADAEIERGITDAEKAAKEEARVAAKTEKTGEEPAAQPESKSPYARPKPTEFNAAEDNVSRETPEIPEKIGNDNPLSQEAAPVEASANEPLSSAPKDNLAPPTQMLENTSSRKVDMEVDRLLAGREALPAYQIQSQNEWRSQARDQGVVERAPRLAAEVIAKPRAFNPVENAGVLEAVARKKVEFNSVLDDISKLTDDSEIDSRSAELRRIEEEYDVLRHGLDIAGTEAGRDLAARKLQLNDRFDILDVRTRAKAAKRGKLTEKETADLDALSTKLQKNASNMEANAAKQSDDLAESVIKVAKAKQYSKMTEAEKDAELSVLMSKARDLLKNGCYPV